MEHIYDVIVIGAGISGIGASSILTKAGRDYIILESRDRIGGRIYSKKLDGVNIDIGASFVHNPLNDNLITKVIEEIGWKTKSAEFQNEQYLYESVGILDEETVDEAQDLYQKLVSEIGTVAGQSENDISLQQAAQQFMSANLPKCSERVRNTFKWLFEIKSNVEGAQLRQLSAKQFSNAQEVETEHDLLPEGGYAKLVQAIFDETNPKVKFNEKVVKIDYEQEVVKVYTQKSVYQAKKVISSLPIGVLLHNVVQFVPPLPQEHTKSLNRIGSGVANKIFVSFEQPFWSTNKRWLNFVTSKPVKYSTAFNLFTDNERYILLFFISAEASKKVSELDDKQIIRDLVQFLRQFYTKAYIKVRGYQVTRWHKDPHAFGSYSFTKVGVTKEDIEQIAKPIDDKIWFIGEHCHPSMNSCVHNAYQTGLWAGKAVVEELQDNN